MRRKTCKLPRLLELNCTYRAFEPSNVSCYKRSLQHPTDWLLKPSIPSASRAYPPSRNPLPTIWRVVSNFPKLRASRYSRDAYRRGNSFSTLPFRSNVFSIGLYFQTHKRMHFSRKFDISFFVSEWYYYLYFRFNKINLIYSCNIQIEIWILKSEI